MQQLLLGLSLAVNVVLGTLIFYRGLMKNRAGLLMSGSIFFVILWTIGDYLLLFSRDKGLVNIGRWMWVVLPMCGILMLYTFAREFIYRFRSRGEHISYLFLMSLAFLWIIYFALHPGNAISSIDINPSGINSLAAKPGGFQFYTLFFSIYFSLAIIVLYIKYHKLRGLEKAQALYLFAGLTLMLVSATITNLLLPSLFNNLRFIWLGPIFSIFYVSSFTYAMLKHRLFDIRTFIVRAAAYFLTFFALALFYVVPVIVLAGKVLSAKLSPGTLFVLVVITLITAMLFQPIRLGFNKFTSRIFYRDYYEPQDLLDKISNLLVASVDLEILEKGSAATLKDHLKVTDVSYLLYKDDNKPEDKHLLEYLSRLKSEISIS